MSLEKIVLDLKKSNPALFDEFYNYLIKKDAENPPTDSSVKQSPDKRGLLSL